MKIKLNVVASHTRRGLSDQGKCFLAMGMCGKLMQMDCIKICVNFFSNCKVHYIRFTSSSEYYRKFYKAFLALVCITKFWHPIAAQFANFAVNSAKPVVYLVKKLVFSFIRDTATVNRF